MATRKNPMLRQKERAGFAGVADSTVGSGSFQGTPAEKVIRKATGRAKKAGAAAKKAGY